MMRVVERFITRARPDLVWQTLADVDRWPEWNAAILQIQPLTPCDLAPGVRYRVSRPGLRPAIFEITRLIRTRQLTWTSARPGLTLVADYKLLLTTAGTEVQVSFETSGFLATLFDSLHGRTLARHLSTEVLNLRDHCRRTAAPPARVDTFVQHRPPA